MAAPQPVKHGESCDHFQEGSLAQGLKPRASEQTAFKSWLLIVRLTSRLQASVCTSVKWVWCYSPLLVGCFEN